MKLEELKIAQFGTTSYEMANELLWAFKNGEITDVKQLEAEIGKITARVRIETLAPFYNALESQTTNFQR